MDMEWLLIIVSGVMIFVGVYLGVGSLNAPRPGSEFRRSVMRTLAWGVLIMGLGFVKFTATYFPADVNFDPDSPSAQEVRETPVEFILDSHTRIGRLENEVAQLKDELKSWRRHYSIVIDLLFYVSIFAAASGMAKEKHVYNNPDS